VPSQLNLCDLVVSELVVLKLCLFCHRPFPGNDELEQFPLGKRVAYDVQRGRLWCICEGCRRWTLAPFEERWEALEEIERSATDRGRLLHQGENIALLRVGELEVVRVGAAGLREEAWWRYGQVLQERQRNARGIVKRGRALYVAWLLLLQVPVFGAWDGSLWIKRAKRARFGKKAWSGALECFECGAPIKELKFDDRDAIQMIPGADALPAIALKCKRCSSGSGELRGPAAVHTLRRLLAFHNFTGADEAGVEAAVVRIERSGSPTQLLQRCVEQRVPVLRLPADAVLGVEIALNEANERALLALDVAELDARWKEEETIAAIVDRELTDIVRRASLPSRER
jgi:hypothetical protein